ncbi:MAG: hypothetical protein HUJ88_11395 [Fusobacterium necrophorum]|nr:hypothetical protein [Fusobacterium necrophorum]
MENNKLIRRLILSMDVSRYNEFMKGRWDLFIKMSDEEIEEFKKIYDDFITSAEHYNFIITSVNVEDNELYLEFIENY